MMLRGANWVVSAARALLGKSSAHTSDFGLVPGELRLEPVGLAWAQHFSAERDRLSALLGTAVIDIQHIGSTAVPGVLAKPILDIAIAIESFEAFFPLVPSLAALGYGYRGEYGIRRRHYFVKGNPRRTHHLHVLEQDSADWERHIRFRDRLLGSPPLASEYSKLKLAGVSEASGSRDVYQSLKSHFIDRNQG